MIYNDQLPFFTRYEVFRSFSGHFGIKDTLNKIKDEVIMKYPMDNNTNNIEYNIARLKCRELNLEADDRMMYLTAIADYTDPKYRMEINVNPNFY